MKMIDLNAWVDSQEEPDRKVLQQAVQLVLRAIAQSSLSPLMVMKGGILLAIRYHSRRFTRDIDFSTSRPFQEVDITALVQTIKAALAPVSADNEHELVLRLQSHQVKPANRPDVSFPTLNLRIGYASRLQPQQVRRLMATGSPQVVQVDYSFNEWASDVETADLEGGALSMYPFHDLVAEKIRSVLQQPIRNRARYQDIYDLFLLLADTVLSDADRTAILRKLQTASVDRQVPVHRSAMRDEKVIELSRKNYDAELPGLVLGKIPAFDTAFSVVQAFFESLPWPAEASLQVQTSPHGR
jgi:predicted nucleotidyltransferase component of viral defense system